MKTLIFLIPTLLILCSCKSPEQKAKNAIKAKLRLSLNDFKSYEPVGFSKLDSSMTSYIWTARSKAIMDSATNYGKYSGVAFDVVESQLNTYTTDEDLNTAAYLMDIAQKYSDKYSAFSDTFRVENERFKPVFKGWRMNHTYRAKNNAGNFLINKCTFYFDPEITKVIDIYDYTNDENRSEN